MGAFYNYKPRIIMCASYNYKPRITEFDFFLDYYGSKVSLAFNCVILYSSAVHRI